MTGDAVASLKTGFGQTITGDLAASLKTGFGQTITGDLAASLNTGLGQTITGDLAASLVGVGDGGGMTMIGDLAANLNTGGGHTITGELAANPLLRDEECVVGAATALTADRARAEPITTHETFNHDEGICITSANTTESAEKTNAKCAIWYTQSNGG
jgi:hypothetical protein